MAKEKTQTAWTNRDIILSDGSALVTLLTPVVLIAKYLHEAHERRVAKGANQQSLIKITAEIDGAPISIEAPDLETAKAALELAGHFQTQHPMVANETISKSRERTQETATEETIAMM